VLRVAPFRFRIFPRSGFSVLNIVTYFAIKVTTDWWNFFYNAKSGKYYSPEKQPFPSELSLYNLWSCFLPPFWSHSEFGDHCSDRAGLLFSTCRASFVVFAFVSLRPHSHFVTSRHLATISRYFAYLRSTTRHLATLLFCLAHLARSSHSCWCTSHDLT
jgi:hypothetical protein